jgi:hypothetical protein
MCDQLCLPACKLLYEVPCAAAFYMHHSQPAVLHFAVAWYRGSRSELGEVISVLDEHMSELARYQAGG